jgi:hypothetical protein
MADIGLRKLVVYRELVVTEAGVQPVRPARQASVAAVLRNPWVGTGPAQDLSEGFRGSPRCWPSC